MTKAFIMLSLLWVAACVPQEMQLSGDRFAIDSYTTYTGTSDISGLWMVIQDGRRVEQSGDLTLTATGKSREIIEISRENGGFYLTSCAEPLQKRAIDEDGNRFTMVMNGYRLDVSSNAGQTRMTGNASVDAGTITYHASVVMQKIAAAGSEFGRFDFLTLAGNKTAQTVDCFQETVTRVVGSRFIFSQWADLRAVIVTDRQGEGAFRQSSFVKTVDGNADPVDAIRFAEKQQDIDLLAQAYPQAGLAIAVSGIESDSRKYQADFSIQDIFAGAVRISF